jgi:hypothetical protein
MSQPKWEFVANLGDVNPIDYGGYFVFRDATGVYPEEAELLIAGDSDEEGWEVRRFILERCTFTDGILSDNKFHPLHPAWFADSLGKIADCNGIEEQVLRMQLCSSCAVERAHAYRCIGDYQGWDNLDSYPLQFSDRAEVESRYANHPYCKVQ